MCLRTWGHFSSSVWAKKVAPSPCFVCHFSLFCFVNTHLAHANYSRNTGGPSTCPHTKKKLVNGGYRPSKWTWTQKIREHWPYSPILHNKKMYMIDSDAHSGFCSPGPISSASHKTTHKKQTKTHRQSVRWTPSQEYFKEELIVEKLFSEYPGLLSATVHLRFLVWYFKRLTFGPGRVLPRSQEKKDHWPMVPYGPISDEKWSRTHTCKKFMVPWVVKNGPNSYLNVNTYLPIYRPSQSITVDIDGR